MLEGRDEHQWLTAVSECRAAIVRIREREWDSRPLSCGDSQPGREEEKANRRERSIHQPGYREESPLIITGR